MSKPSTGSWKCKCCNIFNAAESNYCVTCDSPKDPSLPPKPKIDGFQINSNSSGITSTFTFGIPQDTTKKGTNVFSFRLPTSNDVSKSASLVATKSDAKTDASNAKFVFGTPGKSFGFNFVTKSSK